MFVKEESIDTEKISYMKAEFSKITVRQVCNDGKKTDTYHVKVKGGRDVNSVIENMKATMPSCEVGLIDEDGILGLEYHIFVIVNNEMIKDVMISVYKELNDSLN